MPRRKIEIKKVENKARLQTTFTKRRKGLFRKASNFCDTFDAEAAVVVYSTAGNLFAWGKEQLINDYLRNLNNQHANPPDEFRERRRQDHDHQAVPMDEEEAEKAAAANVAAPAKRGLYDELGTNSAQVDEKLKQIQDWLDVLKEKKEQRGLRAPNL